jgi:nucleoid-associated protein YgaU
MTAMTFETPSAARRALPAGARSARAGSVPARAVPAPARAVPAARSRRPVLRLTRRGRVLVLLVLAVLVLVAFSLGRTSASAGRGGAVVRTTTVVQPGETLWTIARRVAPAADPRATVRRLTELNDLGATPIVAGQRLELPR